MPTTMSRIAPSSVLLLFLAMACGGEAPDPDQPPVQDTVLSDASTPRPGGEPTDTARRPDPGRDPDHEPERDPEPTPPPSRANPVAVGVGQWTVGIVEGGPEAGPGPEPATPTVTAVRTARHPDFDRFVLEFSEIGGLPSFHVEYVDRPVRECGSGHVVELPGDAWLQIRMSGARAHNDEGQVTVETREGSPGLPNLLAHDLTCDFEAHVEWVLAVASPNRFRVLDLREPYRLVVDVRH